MSTLTHLEANLTDFLAMQPQPPNDFKTLNPVQTCNMQHHATPFFEFSFNFKQSFTDSQFSVQKAQKHSKADVSQYPKKIKNDKNRQKTTLFVTVKCQLKPSRETTAGLSSPFFCSASVGVHHGKQKHASLCGPPPGHNA